MAIDINLVKEMIRQRLGQAPSNAGIAGGATTANQVTSDNPLAPMAAARMGASAPPQATTMSQAPLAQVQKSMPNEAQLIIKGLVNRLRSLPGGQA